MTARFALGGCVPCVELVLAALPEFPEPPPLHAASSAAATLIVKSRDELHITNASSVNDNHLVPGRLHDGAPSMSCSNGRALGALTVIVVCLEYCCGNFCL
jgi:hypothetical protein